MSRCGWLVKDQQMRPVIATRLSNSAPLAAGQIGDGRFLLVERQPTAPGASVATIHCRPAARVGEFRAVCPSVERFDLVLVKPADADALLTPSLARRGDSAPANSFAKVDLPAPLTPRSPIRSSTSSRRFRLRSTERHRSRPRRFELDRGGANGRVGDGSVRAPRAPPRSRRSARVWRDA